MLAVAAERWATPELRSMPIEAAPLPIAAEAAAFAVATETAPLADATEAAPLVVAAEAFRIQGQWLVL